MQYWDPVKIPSNIQTKLNYGSNCSINLVSITDMLSKAIPLSSCSVLNVYYKVWANSFTS